jgi:uncharacterized protein YndB with AHSA1/START domain
VHIETTIEIAAPIATVWAVLTDLESWPRWTASVTRLDLLDAGPLRPGSRARVRQPRLPAAVWTVTDLTPGSAFTWISRSPGVTVTGVHELTPVSETATSARLSVDQSGPLAGLVGVLTGALTRRYVMLEAHGLEDWSKRRTPGR